MQVVSIISTKGGVGKTTTAANLGGFIADAGLRVLLLDLDVQPTLSSYFMLSARAPGGIYEMLAFNERRIEQLVSRTAIAGLDLVLSNDDRGELNTLLLHAPDGRLRLRHLLPVFRTHYDLLLVDTQGARSVLLEMAVLASDLALSPVTPEILAARHAATDRGHRAVSAPGHRAAAAASAHQPCASCVVECAAGPAGAATGVSGTGRRAGAGHRRTGHRSLSARCDTRIAGAPGGVPAAGWAHGARGVGDHAHAGRRAVPRVAGALRAGHRSGRCGRGRPWRARMNWRAAANGCAR